MEKTVCDSKLLTIPVSKQKVASLREKARSILNDKGVDFVLDELAYLSALVESLSNRLRAVEGVVDLLDDPRDWVDVDDENYAEELRVSADMILDPDDGFHKFEYDKSGKAFRWTGPSTDFAFFVRLNRCAMRAAVLQIASFSNEEAQGLRCFVDGCLVPHVEERSESSLLFKFGIPGTIRARPTQIRFSVPKVWRPQEKNPESKDDRLLGVAFQALEIRNAV